MESQSTLSEDIKQKSELTSPPIVMLRQTCLVSFTCMHQQICLEPSEFSSFHLTGIHSCVVHLNMRFDCQHLYPSSPQVSADYAQCYSMEWALLLSQASVLKEMRESLGYFLQHSEKLSYLFRRNFSYSVFPDDLQCNSFTINILRSPRANVPASFDFKNGCLHVIGIPPQSCLTAPLGTVCFTLGIPGSHIYVILSPGAECEQLYVLNHVSQLLAYKIWNLTL